MMQRYLGYGITAMVAAVIGGGIVLGLLVLDYFRDQRRMARREKGPCTFLIQDTDVMLLAVRGTYKQLGEYHLIVTEANGWPHVIDRRDIVEVIA